MKASIAIVLAFCVFTTVSGKSTAASTTQFPLDGTAIQQAIEWGEKGDPAPYMLQWKTSKLDRVAIYTPFVRIALTVRHLDSGLRLTPETLPPELLDPFIYTVFRWPCPGPSCEHPEIGASHSLDSPVWVVAVPRGHHQKSPDRIQPEWVTKDLSFLHPMGGVPFEGAVVAAAFRLYVIRPGTDLLAFWGEKDPQMVTGGEIRDAEFARWR